MRFNFVYVSLADRRRRTELTAEDVRCVSARYWQFHTDPLLAVDGSVGTLLTIHFNLCIGTVAMFASERPDLAESLDQLLRFELS